MTDWPMREITDARTLRAMAHPLRLKLMDALVIGGPATATELGDRLAETPANCSWHLRQLAKYGFVEEASDLPRQGRNRPWRWVPKGNRWGLPGESPEFARVGAEVTSTLLGYELAQRDAWDAHQATEPADWRQAAFTAQTVSWLTAEELAEIHEKIRDLIMSHTDRYADPTARPAGARPIRFIAWGIPSAGH